MSASAYRALIGIPAGSYDSSHPGVKTFRFNGNYTAALVAAGGLPVAIPLNLPDDALRALFERLNGVCLAGGDDLAPVHYGETPHPALGLVDALRDHVELKLARWALDADLPLLGICRGIQALNVAAGGSLYQDLSAQCPSSFRHAYELSESPWERATHPVSLAPDSRLARLLGTTELQTNSFHHQAVKQVAPGFVPVGWAPDGVIEAIESPAHHFALGIQWHPEAMTETEPLAGEIFSAFAAACRSC